MKHFSLGVLVLGSMLILSACGGGGGVTQSTPVNMGPTPSEVRAIFNARASVADALYLTDVVVPTSSRLLPGARIITNCLGASCSYEVLGYEFTVSTADFVSNAGDGTLRVTPAVHGVPTARLQGSATEEGVTLDYTNYGGWLNNSLFGYALGTYREPALVQGVQALYAFSFGTESGSNPMTGSATWTGAMVGVHSASPTQSIEGRTEAIYSFADQTLDVSMTQLTRGHPNLQWRNLPVQQGSFQSWGIGENYDASDYLYGTFYGDAHEEVGGAFEQRGIVGAFGAQR